MADDMTGKIMEILNNPEMMRELTDVIGKMGLKDGEKSENPAGAEDIALGAKKILSGINSSDDRRINLLNAIKPYLRESRASGVDKAIRMLQITKITDALKNERR